MCQDSAARAVAAEEGRSGQLRSKPTLKEVARQNTRVPSAREREDAVEKAPAPGFKWRTASLLEYAFFLPVTPYLSYGRKNQLELEDMPTQFIGSCESNTTDFWGRWKLERETKAAAKRKRREELEAKGVSIPPETPPANTTSTTTTTSSSGDSAAGKGGEKKKTTKKSGKAPRHPLARFAPSVWAVLSGWDVGLLVLSGVLYAIQQASQIAGPLLLRLILEELEGNPQRCEESPSGWCFAAPDKNRQYMLAGLFLAAPVMASVCLQNSSTILQYLGTKYRGAMMGAIYGKCLKLSNASLQAESLGKVVTLMSADSEQILQFMAMPHSIWCAPIMIITIFYLLYDVVGPSMFVGLGISILLVPMTGSVAKKLTVARKSIVKHTDERVKMCNEMLAGVKVMKFYCWEDSFIKRIMEHREREMAILKKIANISAIFSGLVFTTPTLINVAVLCVYWAAGNDITASVAFTSIAYFSILRFPLGFTPFLVALYAQLRVSLTRISKYLEREESVEAPKVEEDAKLEPGSVELRHASFDWEPEDASKEPFLKELNVSLKPGSLVMVVGPVGSGKSAFASSLINTIQCVEGQVSVKGRVAYVAQSAWIMNATLENNVRFGLPMERERYEKVLDICCLGPDLEILPGGDQTEIGEKGVNLSGGQKQRVSLARAVYWDADTVIMDDPLSAVDSHVGQSLFDNCITGDLLKGKTRILMTNALQYLPQADHIIVLNNGRISEQGSYDELVSSGLDFAALMVTHDVEKEDEDEEKKGTGDAAKGASGPASKPSAPTAESKLTQKEGRAVGSISLEHYKAYIVAGVPLALAAVVGLLFAADQGSRAANNAWLGEWAEATVDPDRKYGNGFYIGIFCLLAILNALAGYFRSLFFLFATVRSANGLFKQLLTGVARLPMSFFDTTPSGRIVNRFSSDTNVLDNTIGQTAIQLGSCMASIIATLVVISVASPWFVLALLPIMLVYFGIQRFYIPGARETQRLESVSRSPIYANFSETLAGLTTIRAFRAEEQFAQLNYKFVDVNTRTYYCQKLCNNWLGMRLEALGNLIVLFAAFLAVGTNVSSALAGLAIAYALDVTQALKFGTSMVSQMETQMNAVQRVLEYAREQQEPSHATEEKVLAALPPAWPAQGAIAFQNIVMRYRPGLEPALRSLDMAVAAGEKLGVVGRTGSGKSSLFLCLFRIVELSSGSILIDGVDIATLGLRKLRSSLGMIPQDPFMFAGSARLNIDPFNEFEDARLVEVVEQVGLKAAVAELGGLDGAVTEGGANLSLGQRQLFCLARAILRQSRVLCMDEATASVDLDTDNQIQDIVRSSFAECTVLTIAHRLHTVIDADRVAVLDQGRVAELGVPDELLQKEQGFLSELVDRTGKKTAKTLRRRATLARSGMRNVDSELSLASQDETDAGDSTADLTQLDK